MMLSDVCMSRTSGLSQEQRGLGRLQEAQLMLTNLRDAFRGQSRSPNIVAFHVLCIVSSCAIVTLSLRLAGFSDIRLLQKCRVRGPSRSLAMSPCDRAHMTSY